MKPWIAALLVLLAVPAMAQQYHHDHGTYAGMQRRAVKALSEQQDKLNLASGQRQQVL